MRALTVELLTSAGYTVLEAPDGNTAIEIAKRHQHSLDLLLTDVIMPGMSGVDLVTHLRRIKPKVATLFMSGYAHHLLTRAGVPEEERLVLHKPFAREVLLTKVRSILDEARARC